MNEEKANSVLQISESLSIPLEEFTFRVSRSSGPGGQNVNKVSSKVMLRWNVLESKSIPEDILSRFKMLNRNRITSLGFFVISSERYRAQPRNKEECLRKLSELISEASIPSVPRKRTKPSKGSKLRNQEVKKRRSELKSLRKNIRPD